MPPCQCCMAPMQNNQCLPPKCSIPCRAGHPEIPDEPELKLSIKVETFHETPSGLTLKNPPPPHLLSSLCAPQPVLQNIVSTVSLGTAVDLRKVALHARNIEYNPKRFGAAVLRIRSPRTTALLFSSGKMVITGAKSHEQSKEAGRKFARIVQKLGFPAQFTNFKIQNIVACVNVNFNIRLEGVALMHHQFSTYEPELFPGIVYRMVRPRVVLLIFSTGKVVITGAQTEEDIDLAFKAIHPLLKMFKKGD